MKKIRYKPKIPDGKEGGGIYYIDTEKIPNKVLELTKELLSYLNNMPDIVGAREKIDAYTFIKSTLNDLVIRDEAKIAVEVAKRIVSETGTHITLKGINEDSIKIDTSNIQNEKYSELVEIINYLNRFIIEHSKNN